MNETPEELKQRLDATQSLPSVEDATGEENPLDHDDAHFFETPYDFRAEYKDKVAPSDIDDNNIEKRFSSLRFQTIGLGILIGFLSAILVSVIFYGFSEEEDTAPIVIEQQEEEVKTKPENVGGMEIPNQDKLVYKRMRTNEVDTKVESLYPVPETPAAPVRPLAVAQQEKEVAQNAPVALKEPSVVVLPQEQKTEVLPLKPVEPQEQKAVEVKQEEVKTSLMTDGEWHVQLISLPSKNAAQKAWPEILKKHTVLLSGLPYDIVAVDIPNKGTFYRLRVGSFKNKADAKALCDKLKAKKQDCALTK